MTAPSTDVVRSDSAALSLRASLDYSRALATSNMLPAQYRNRPENVLWAMEYGRTIGLTPMAAITGVHVIEGKPTASAGLISGLVRKAGHRLRVTGDDTRAVAEIVRSDDPDHVFRSEWTIARAKQAELLGKGTWKKYPAAMLKARAITEVARDACEEVLYGLHYTPEELGCEVDEDGVTVVQVGPQNGAPVAETGPATEPAPITPAVALKTAAQAAACDDVRVLHGVRKWVTEKGMEGADVRPAVEAAATALNLPDGPLALGAWLDECITRVDSEGLSIEEQVKVLTADDSVTDVEVEDGTPAPAGYDPSQEPAGWEPATTDEAVSA